MQFLKLFGLFMIFSIFGRSQSQIATAAVSTTVMLAYGIGMGLGRWYIGQILFKFHLDQQLLAVIGIQFVGFAIFWFSHIFALSLVGLFFIGVG
ncbi:MAG: hypothetical protein ACK5EZ_08710, partial [Bacteroidota bacterium]